MIIKTNVELVRKIRYLSHKKADKFYWIFLLIMFLGFSSLFSTDFTLSKIEINGNYFLSDNTILSRSPVKENNYFDMKQLQTIGLTVSKIYEDFGYFNVIIDYPEIIPLSSSELKLIINVKELSDKKPVLINLSGNKLLSEKRLRRDLAFNEDQSFEFKNIFGLMQSIVEYYSEIGFLFSKISIKSIKSNEDNYLVILEIYEGPICRFTDYLFEGNKVTKDKTILKLSQINKMQSITRSKIKNAEESLRRKSYIRDCSILPIDNKTLLFKINEDKMTHISGIFGYDSGSGSSSLDSFNGYVNLAFLNLYGTDRSLAFTWKHASKYKSSIEFKYHESGLYRFPIAADFKLYREKQDSTYILTRFDTELYYYTNTSKYGIYGGIDDYFPGSRRPIIIEKNSQKKIGFLWEYNNVDYFLNPRNGIEFKIKYYLISKNNDDETSFNKAVETSWSNYIPISSRWVFAPEFNLNQVNGNAINSFDLYNLGGFNTIRGFQEDQFQGSRTAWTNIEMRYLLSRRSRIYTFSDYGYVEYPENNQTKRLTDLFGLGFGLRIETKIGMFGIDYGFSYQNGEWLNPLDGMIHFGFDSKF